MNPLFAYLPMDRLHALAEGGSLPEWSTGSVLFADISGFTPLTASLARELGARRGAEELTRTLNEVYEVLIAAVHGQGGSVIAFSGDAITCFFHEASGGGWSSAPERAVHAAIRMQRAMASIRVIHLPAATPLSLSVRVAVEAGRVRRFLVGDPDTQLLEVIAGATVDRLGSAAHLAAEGEVIAGPGLVAALGRRLRVAGVRDDAGPDRYALVEGCDGPETESRWEAVPAASIEEGQVKPWLLEPIYDRLRLGQHEFLAELRPATAVFLKFDGIDYEADADAGTKLDAFVRWVQHVVARSEGSVIDVTTGDKGSYLYAAFGAPVAHPDNARRAVDAGLALSAPPAGIEFISGVHIGISHGRMRTGPYGSSTRRAYGVLGDDTNLAARLMESASARQVLVSESVMTAVARPEWFKGPLRLSLKGRTAPVSAFEVLPPQGRSAVPSKTVAMVGREKERALLEVRLDDLAGGGGGVLAIEGEPGIGKSALIGHLAEIATARHLRVLFGSTSALERSTPYYAWRSVLSDMLGVDSLDDPARIRERVLAESSVDAELAQFAPLLNAFLPLDLPDNEITSRMKGEARAEKTHDLVVHVMSGITQASGGVVLVLEDAHWMDSASWSLARRVSREVTRLFLVIGTRPMQSPPPEYESMMRMPAAATLRLDPLAPADALALVARRLGVSTLPPPVARLIRDKAQGNPFFSEELAYALRDQRVIEIDGGECRVRPGVDVKALDFPDTVEGVVTSRLDQLPPSQQLTVKLASVIGRVFPYQLLADVHPMRDELPRLAGDLEALERLDLTSLHASEPDRWYAFKHAITQEVAYNLLLFGQRRQLHRAVAEWYEREHGDDLSLFYPLLAHHWGAAQTTSKALHYLERAGDQALNNDANTEARRFFEDAIALDAGCAQDAGVEPLRRARWNLGLGEAHHRMGLLADSERAFRDALRYMDHSIPDSPAALVQGVVSQILRQAQHRLVPAGPARPRGGDGNTDAMALAHRGFERLSELSFLHGRPGLVVYETLRSLNLAEAAGPSRQLAHGYSAVCVACGVIPAHMLARLYERKALEVAHQLDDPSALADVLFTTGVYRAGVGDFTAADDRVREAADLFERFGNLHRWGMCMQVLCRVAWTRGDVTRFAELTDRLHACGVRREDVLQQIWGLNNRAEYLLMNGGDPADALDCATAALPLIGQCSEAAAEMISRSLIALALLRLGRIESGVEAAAAVLALISSAPRPTSFGMLGAYETTADVQLWLWEHSAASDSSSLQRNAGIACRALEQFAAVFPIGRPRALLRRGRYYWLAGRRARARKLWARALARAQQLAMSHDEHLALDEITRARAPSR